MSFLRGGFTGALLAFSVLWLDEIMASVSRRRAADFARADVMVGAAVTLLIFWLLFEFARWLDRHLQISVRWRR